MHKAEGGSSTAPSGGFSNFHVCLIKQKRSFLPDGSSSVSILLESFFFFLVMEPSPVSAFRIAINDGPERPITSTEIDVTSRNMFWTKAGKRKTFLHPTAACLNQAKHAGDKRHYRPFCLMRCCCNRQEASNLSLASNGPFASNRFLALHLRLILDLIDLPILTILVWG